MKMRRMVCIVLALLVCTGSLLACAEKNEKTSGNAVTQSENQYTESNNEETKVDPLAGLNFNGEKIRIYLSVNNQENLGAADYLIRGPEEETGDVVDDAVYERNMNVQELLNVQFEYTEVDLLYDKVGADILKIIMSGDDVYDIMINDLYPLAGLSVDGMFRNVADNKYMDFSQKYWWKDYMEDLSIGNGAMYLLAGDYFMDIIKSAHALYFNKTMLGNLSGNSNELYQKVIDGKWTHDEFLKYVKLAYSDLNGDSKKDKLDQFGYTSPGRWGAAIPFMIGSDISFVERDKEGIPHLAMNNERSVKLLENLNKIFYNESGYSDYSAEEIIPNFVSGRSLFAGYQRLGNFADLRDMKDEVGILPYPKMDETQKQYITSSHDTTELGVIPITCTTKFDTVCAVIEALCRETSKTVLPAYYEMALKIKYARDDISSQMIDIIHDNIRDSFPLAYNNRLDNILLSKAFSDPLAKKSADFSSAYAKAEPKAIVNLEKMVEAFIANTK